MYPYKESRYVTTRFHSRFELSEEFGLHRILKYPRNLFSRGLLLLFLLPLWITLAISADDLFGFSLFRFLAWLTFAHCERDAADGDWNQFDDSYAPWSGRGREILPEGCRNKIDGVVRATPKVSSRNFEILPQAFPDLHLHLHLLSLSASRIWYHSHKNISSVDVSFRVGSYSTRLSTTLWKNNETVLSRYTSNTSEYTLRAGKHYASLSWWHVIALGCCAFLLQMIISSPN